MSPPRDDTPTPLWTSVARSSQPYFRVVNDSQNHQFQMSSFPNSRISRDLSEYSHEIYDTTSVRSGTSLQLRQNEDGIISGKSYLSLRFRRAFSVFQRMHGYRFGATCCAGLTGTVFLINLVLTIWAWTKFDVNEGIGTIHQGNCDRTKSLSLWLHLAVNVLGTALLSASNYCMQCLSAPTRQVIDKAHAQNKWLDIGVPSVRNLRFMTRKRIILWSLLAITSLPLHLMYNSAIFNTLSTYNYNVFVVSKEFLSGAPFNMTTKFSSRTVEGILVPMSSRLDSFRNPNPDIKVKKFEEIKDCVMTYGSGISNSKYKDVLLITTASNATDSLLRGWPRMSPTWQDGSTDFGWFCTSDNPGFDLCIVEESANNAQNWEVAGYQIDYCLSEEMDEKCDLQFSLPIMIIVVTCNLVKTSCMILVVFGLGGVLQPLVTVGDAIASFLNEPDPATKSMCLADKAFFQKEGWQARRMRWWPKRHRWFRAASLSRWMFCNVLCLSTLIIAIVLLRFGLNNASLVSKSISHLWKMGYGAVNVESLIALRSSTRSDGIMEIVLVVNAPQVIISFLFVTYNGLFSCMLLMKEWNGFAHERKPLRVTLPIGMQRSSYWLQLPYTYGVPLLVMSGALHWLVSQSIFLARVIVRDEMGIEDVNESISTAGYSCIAIISAIILGSIIVLFGILTGLRSYKEGMPLVGSSSAAISAACHRLRNDPDASTLSVLWGAVEKTGAVGHCCFSSLDVSPPVEGEVYAGEEEIMKSDLG